jgi:hypothetical protein
MTTLIEVTGLAKPSAGDRKADLTREIKAVEGRLKTKQRHFAALRLLRHYLSADDYQYIKERIEREIKRREEQFYDLHRDLHRWKIEHDPCTLKTKDED